MIPEDIEYPLGPSPPLGRRALCSWPSEPSTVKCVMMERPLYSHRLSEWPPVLADRVRDYRENGVTLLRFNR